MTIGFPLPIVWQHPLNVDFVPRHRCVVNAESVTIRCGDSIVQTAAQDGTEQWRLTVVPGSGGGAFFLRAGTTLLSEFTRPAERLSTLFALGVDGRLLWSSDLPAILMPAAVNTGESVLVPAIDPSAGSTIRQINVVDGNVVRNRSVPWGAHGVLPVRGKLLVRNQVVENGAPGVYTLDLDDGVTHPMIKESAWRLEGNNESIMIVTRSSVDSPRRLLILHAEELSTRWECATLANETAVLDGKSVVTTIIDGGEYYLAALETGSGALQWRTGPLDTPAMQIYASGPLIVTRSRGVNRLYRRADGAPLGMIEGIVGPPVAHNNRLFLCVEEALVCALLT
jgi:hypothetical protein